MVDVAEIVRPWAILPDAVDSVTAPGVVEKVGAPVLTGAAQVPSPRQKVDDDALVPLLR